MSSKSSLKIIKGLYCITNTPGKLSYEKLVESFCAAGANIVQFRAKELTASEMFSVGKKLRDITKHYKVPLIVNDRLDVAVLIGADGVHFGQEDLPIEETKNLLKMLSVSLPLLKGGWDGVWEDFIIGISTHTLKQAIDAEKNGADYISFGPIFHSLTKPELKPVGVELLKAVKSKVKIPVVAIGGINEKNIQQVIETNTDAVAVISAVYSRNPKNIKKSIENLKSNILENK